MATGTGNLPNQNMSFTPFDILTAEEQNDLVENIESLATGAGIGDGAIKSQNIDFTTPVTSTTGSITLSTGTWFILGTAVMRSTGDNLVAECQATLNGYSQVITLRQNTNNGGLGGTYCLPSIAVVATTQTFNWVNSVVTGALVQQYKITAVRVG